MEKPKGYCYYFVTIILRIYRPFNTCRKKIRRKRIRRNSHGIANKDSSFVFFHQKCPAALAIGRQRAGSNNDITEDMAITAPPPNPSSHDNTIVVDLHRGELLEDKRCSWRWSGEPRSRSQARTVGHLKVVGDLVCGP